MTAPSVRSVLVLELVHVLALAPLVLAACGKDASAPRNVLLITLDTTRADHLSCYGAKAGATPSLDALAAEGTRFDLAESTASVTPVSHAAILTGLYNHEHGLRVLFAGGGYRLKDGADTLATVLAAHGYHTLAVHSAFPVSRFFGLERGFELFDDLQTDVEEQQGEFKWDVAAFQRRSDETTDRVIAKLGEQPFFLWVHYWDPHDLAKLPPGLSLKDAHVKPGVQPFYAEEVQFVDSQVGRLFDALRAKELYDDTLIVVVADHGQGLLDHDWPAHRLLYQEEIRVPLIVRVPGATQVRAVSDLVRTVDIFPTILDYLGLAPPHPVSGRSLRPLLEGAPDEPRTALADQLNGYDWNAGMVHDRPLDDFLYAAVERDWKLIYRPRHFEESELYQLSRDPREEHNLFTSHPADAERLLERLAEAAPWVATPFEPPAHGADTHGDNAGGSIDDARHTLDGLGYTGSEPVDAQWAWTCPAHLDRRSDAPGPCPVCGKPPLLIGR